MVFTQKLFLKRRYILNIFWLGSKTTVRANQDIKTRINLLGYISVLRDSFAYTWRKKTTERGLFSRHFSIWLINHGSVYPRSCLTPVLRNKFNLPLIYPIIKLCYVTYNTPDTQKQNAFPLERPSWQKQTRHLENDWEITIKDNGNSSKKELILDLKEDYLANVSA